MKKAPDLASLVVGHDHLERTARGLRPHRLPAWVAEQRSDPQLSAAQSQPAGVRLAFTTTAQRIELLLQATRAAYVGIDRPRGVVDLVIDDRLVESRMLARGDALVTDLRAGTQTLQEDEPDSLSFEVPAGEKRVELWLPHNESAELLDLRADAPVSVPCGQRRLWLHHGSSISQGSNATTPASTWVSTVARRAGVDVRNLGVGGSAIVDPFMARVIRDSPADLLSLKLGINVVNTDAMRLRAFVPALHGFLDTIRDGHPDTPLVVVSPLFCDIHEHTSGPGAFDPAALAAGRVSFVATGPAEGRDPGRLTLSGIREAFTEVVEHRGDPHLHLIDGTALYGALDAVEHPLPDALHPDTATHQLIAERFAGRVFAEAGAFASPGSP